MKIKKVEIDAFRLFDGVEIPFLNERHPNSANLVAIHAPNGFGKTSFFDAIEFCVTKNIQRLKISNFTENVKSDKQANDYSSFIHNRQTPDKNIRIAITCEDGAPIVREVKSDEELKWLKGEPENSYFGEVLLSQDWFNQFLSTTDATMRFEIFTRNFKDTRGLLEYYESLKSARIIINKQKARKKADVKTAQKKLETDVDVQIVDKLKESIEELSREGIDISWKQRLDERQLQQLQIEGEQKGNDVLLERRKIMGVLALIEQLCNGYDGLVKPDDFAIHIEKQELLNKEIESLGEKLEKILRLKKLLQTIEEISKQLARFKAENEELNYLLKGYAKYQETTDEIKELDKKRNATLQERQVNDELLKQRIKDKEQLNNRYDGLVKKWEEWKNRITRLPGDYKVYSQLKKEQEQLNAEETKTKLRSKQLKQSEETALRTRQSLRDSIKVIRQPVLITGLPGFEEEIKKINLLTQSIREKENTVNQQANTIAQQSKYLSQVGALVVKAREMSETLSTGTCPLCGHNYGDVEGLLKAIESNASVSSGLEAIIRQKAEIEKEIEAEKDEKERLIRSIEGALNLKLRAVVESLQKIDEENTTLRKILSGVAARQQAIKDQMSTAFISFEGVTEEQVASLYKEKALQAEKDAGEVKILVEGVDKEIEGLQNKIKTCGLQIEEVSKAIVGKQNEHAFAEYHRRIIERKEEPVSATLWQQSWDSNSKQITEFAKKLEETKKERYSLEAENVILAEETAVMDRKNGLAKEKDELEAQYIRTIRFVKEECRVENVGLETNPQTIMEKIKQTQESCKTNLQKNEKKAKLLEVFTSRLAIAGKFVAQLRIQKIITEQESEIRKLEKQIEEIDKETEGLKKYLEDFVDSFFQKDLINKLYNTIDPHPTYKEVEFKCDFEQKKPRLYVIMGSRIDENDKIVPNLYLSTAQINILSFCIFMAKALFAKTDDNKNVDCIFVDDPIQALDDINVLSMIDLLRNIAFTLNKQIVITTHDKNFFGLLQKKIPQDKFNACYWELYERGKFRRVEI